MKLKINNVRISLRQEQTLEQAVCRKCGIPRDALGSVRIVRKAVDARKKNDICLNYHVLAEVETGGRQAKRLLADRDITQYQEQQQPALELGTLPLSAPPVVIGAGPAGLLAALQLAEHGYKPVAQRVQDVQRFWQTGEFNPASNVQFGEGGAGTFSDGKLTTRVNDPMMAEILQLFVDAGAPENILYEHKPHVGTDKLRAMVQGLSRRIAELGGSSKELDAIITDEGEKQRKIDLLSYQVQEIEDASLTAGEEETLAARRKVLANASTIRERISQSYALLSGGDDAPGAVDLLGEASNAIDGAAQLDSGLSAAAGQLLDLYYTAKDLSADLIGRLEGYETNDAELDEIEQRMDLIYKLKRKYGDTVEDIIAFGQQAREELDRIQFSQERTEHLQAEKHRLYVLARDKAEVLTQTRLKAFEELNRRISGTLDFLNMPGVRMTLRHTRGPLASHGQDSVEFYISTNPGEDPKPLAKIASGGELSRITLAIKNAMADKDAVPTVIYDEIDSGVSGKAASRIGEVLKQSAKDHQILCITHTAQIAALADCHLLIQKNITNERTYTEIHPLDTEGRVDALAHIISGDHVTELSRANAREMLGLAEHETGD